MCDEAPPEVDPEDLSPGAPPGRVRHLHPLLARRGQPAREGLLLGGVFSRAEFPLPQAELMAQSIARLREIPSGATASRRWRLAPEPTFAGYPALAEWVGDKRARVVAEWLGYPDTATVGGPEVRTWGQLGRPACSTTEEPPA